MRDLIIMAVYALAGVSMGLVSLSPVMVIAICQWRVA